MTKLMSRGIADSVEALGKCLIQSSAYAKKYNHGLIRVTGYEFSGREHWAVYTDIGEDETGRFIYSYTPSGTVIDLTARQFVTTVPAKYEEEADIWLENACTWLGDSLRYEIFLTHDFQADPVNSGNWVVDIDPIKDYKEYAAITQMKEREINERARSK
jgi:hypothetical protein